jgi:hypothetical protein
VRSVTVGAESPPACCALGAALSAPLAGPLSFDDGEPPLPFGAAPEALEALEENRAVPTRFAPGGELGDADALPAFAPDDVAGFGA